MKPRWTIKHATWVDGCRWTWFRHDRNGITWPVGCVAHHSWTKRVKAFEVTP